MWGIDLGTLVDLGKRITELADVNSMYAEIAESSLSILHGYLVSKSGEPASPAWTDEAPLLMPPQIRAGNVPSITRVLTTPFQPVQFSRYPR
jgi:hypothetical protein